MPSFVQHCMIPVANQIFGIRSYSSNKNYIYITDGIEHGDYFLAMGVHGDGISWTHNRDLDQEIDGVDIV